MENNNETKKIELNDINLEFANGGREPDTGSANGIKCPNCGAHIPVTIQDIITKDSITCPNCKLCLPIDKTKNNNAIDALRKVKEAEEKLKEKKES